MVWCVWVISRHQTAASAIRRLLTGDPEWCWRHKYICFHTAEHDILPCAYVETHTRALSPHFTEAVWESQNAEPEGCCVSDVWFVYSVVPVHVGDCCALRPQSSLVLFNVTGVDSRSLSRRAERPRKERRKKMQRSKKIERDLGLYLFPLYCFTHCFSLLFRLSLIPLSSNLCPRGSPAVRHPEEGAASLLILSSFTFHILGYAPFCPLGIVWEPQVSEPKPGLCHTDVNLLSEDLRHTSQSPTFSTLVCPYFLSCPKSLKSHWRKTRESLTLLIKFFFYNTGEEGRGGR